MTRYFFRFDDLCPTMRWQTWERIEKILVRHGIRPILAVVPENRDPSLAVDAPRTEEFWERARLWQKRGYAIGLHGCHHVYDRKQVRNLLPVRAESEFSGLSFIRQKKRIDSGLAVFAARRIRADLWVAPGHAFDTTTLRVLAAVGLKTVSDGYYLRPVRDAHSIVWLPQQLSGPRTMPLGWWTFCLHPNTMAETDIERFERFVARHQDACRFSPLEMLRSARPLGIGDRICQRLLLGLKRVGTRLLKGSEG